jgi:hypothetical protein
MREPQLRKVQGVRAAVIHFPFVEVSVLEVVEHAGLDAVGHDSVPGGRAGQLDDLAAVLPLGHDDDPDFRAGRAPDQAGDFLGGLAAELAPLAPLALDAAEPVADFDPAVTRGGAAFDDTIDDQIAGLRVGLEPDADARGLESCSRIDRQLRDGTCLVPVERDAMLSSLVDEGSLRRSSFQNSVSSERASAKA